jgi:hypothetical protein
MIEVVVIPASELNERLLSVLELHEKRKEARTPVKVYNINQVAKMLGKSYNTIKKYVDKGIIKSTLNGLITESAINEYLGQ